jgi:hypothetical protein
MMPRSPPRPKSSQHYFMIDRDLQEIAGPYFHGILGWRHLFRHSQPIDEGSLRSLRHHVSDPRQAIGES